MAKKKVSQTATGYSGNLYDTKFKAGMLHLIDNVATGDPKLPAAIDTYAANQHSDRRSKQWVRAVQWIENILFSQGRHYVDDILVSRISRDSNSGDQSVINDATRSIPRPVNDLLGRYIETNIALLTENRPRPRVTAKSDRAEDLDAAELSELTLEYLWEALRMPEKHREMARLLMNCGICWMEIIHDPTLPRRMSVPQTRTEDKSLVPTETGPITVPIPRQVPVVDEHGRPQNISDVLYGDISAKIISPFEMHVPYAHEWDADDMGWIMREYYTPKDVFRDKFADGKRKMGLTKKKGWHLENLETIGTTNIQNLALWWWERLADLVEGPGPSLYVGTPEQWESHTVVRVFDRKPSVKWPKGRTIITAGEKLIYDSPKEIGARAYDERWPSRWHPYIRFRWEAQPGSIYGRSLVSKLLPKLKRVNAIDTTLIMWRRTVPIATWIAPKGSHPVEDQWSGKPGQIWTYDPRRTVGKEPTPVYPPDYPRTALEERQQQIAEMESIAGTEEILRGQRPSGVNSAAMIDVLRKQALASRSAILQSWDESLQEEGSILLQETIKHVDEDPTYAERIRILAREKQSRMSIKTFSGMDLSDNVLVRVDTASLALVSKEAREAKAIEFLQYAQGLMQLPPGLRQSILDEMGYPEALTPQGPDVHRVKRMLALIRQEQYQTIAPMPEDDPYIFYEFLVNEMKSDQFVDLNQQQQGMIFGLIKKYQQMIEVKEQQEMQAMMAQAEVGIKPPNG